MVAIGLLDVPPEIQLQIAEFVNTNQTLKALSVTSRSLRNIAQSVLFETLQIDLIKGLRGSIDDLLPNPRICAAIRFLKLRGQYLLGPRPAHNDEEKLSLINKILPRMVGLRKVWFTQVNLSKGFLDAVLGIAANNPLQIDLRYNRYPSGIIIAPNTRLRISSLHIFDVDHHSLEFCRTVFHAFATTLTVLDMRANGDGLMKLADIDLPFLHDLTLRITTTNEVSRLGAAAFITAQRSIRKLHLMGGVRPLPPIPPDALPDLQELYAPTELVNQLVPGRPVESIGVSGKSQGYGQDWFGEEVARSTAQVRKLGAYPHSAILDTRMAKRMATILPSLESVWLAVFDDVSDPCTRITLAHFLQTLLDVVEALISLKCLKNLRFYLIKNKNGEKRVNHNVNGIATKMRNANSSFSFLEIQGGGVSGWKKTIFVWNEVLGVFQLYPPDST